MSQVWRKSILAGSAALAVALPGFCFAQTPAPDPAAKLTYSEEVREIDIPSSADGAIQKALWFNPGGDKPVPLLVALHTWSGNYKQAGGESLYEQWCVHHGWAFIHPDFRGPNLRPEACGSDLAVADVVDAVNYAKANAKVDGQRIYLVGVSGGGYFSMLLAGRHPEIWAGVSAWCGISDLMAWHAFHSQSGQPDRYARNIEASCGGAPGSPVVDRTYWHRSPLTWLHQARESGVNLDIAHGIHDGVTGSVPFSHSLHAFNVAAAPPDRLLPSQVYQFENLRKWPGSELFPVDPIFGPTPLYFRRTSGNVRVTIFEGGHEIVHHAALNWLAQQRKGQPAIWAIDPLRASSLLERRGKAESGK